MMDSWEDMAAHLEDEYRQSEDEADPEAPGHVDQLIAGAALGAHSRRLERHAADRTGAGMVLPNFRVHGARPDRSFGDPELGTAACRERVFQYVCVSVAPG